MPSADRLIDPDASATKISRVCGSSVSVEMKMTDDVVSEFAVEARACALGQASSSLLSRHIIGATADELRLLRDEMLLMLKEEGAPPSGERWAELEKLQPIKEYPARHASTMLAFEAVVACLDKLGL